MTDDVTVQKPTDIVVFGGHGDLARRKLLPSLYALFRDRLIPQDLRIIGVSRGNLSDDEYRVQMREAVREFSHNGDFKPDVWHEFASRLTHDTVDGTDHDSMATLLPRFRGDDGQRDRIYYLATPPQLYGPISENLAHVGLVSENARVVLEKPIGHDLASAQEINERVCRHFAEDHVFRIDHYLGKETVQNLMALRFGNALFEPLWRRGRIDHVQITVSETIGVGDRGEYYDSAGAMRDMVQNHLLQLLCLVAMEPPFSLDPDAVRDEKLKVLRALRPIKDSEVLGKTVRGQYKEGAIDGVPVVAYRAEEKVDPASMTETFVALQAEIDNWRWAGIPFYLRTGKRMAERFSEIILHFRPLPHVIFDQKASEILPNRLIIRLQPDEGIRMMLMAKQPGRHMRLRPVSLDLNLVKPYSGHTLTAYERLLLDVCRTDPTLFMRRDEVDAAWMWTEHILQGWEENQAKLRFYVAGTWGPSKAVTLVEQNNHSWSEDAT